MGCSVGDSEGEEGLEEREVPLLEADGHTVSFITLLLGFLVDDFVGGIGTEEGRLGVLVDNDGDTVNAGVLLGASEGSFKRVIVGEVVVRRIPKLMQESG